MDISRNYIYVKIEAKLGVTMRHFGGLWVKGTQAYTTES